MSAAIVLFAHGARDPEWALPFEKMRALIQQRLPETTVLLSYLELMQPNLETAIGNLEQQGISQVTLIPMFLARGGHLKQDLPKLIDRIQSNHSGLSVKLAPAIGEVDTILNMLSDWVCTTHQQQSK